MAGRTILAAQVFGGHTLIRERTAFGPIRRDGMTDYSAIGTFRSLN
jgi:hypothetical protein